MFADDFKGYGYPDPIYGNPSFGTVKFSIEQKLDTIDLNKFEREDFSFVLPQTICVYDFNSPEKYELFLLIINKFLAKSTSGSSKLREEFVDSVLKSFMNLIPAFKTSLLENGRILGLTREVLVQVGKFNAELIQLFLDNVKVDGDFRISEFDEFLNRQDVDSRPFLKRYARDVVRHSDSSIDYLFRNHVWCIPYIKDKTRVLERILSCERPASGEDIIKFLNGLCESDVGGALKDNGKFQILVNFVDRLDKNSFLYKELKRNRDGHEKLIEQFRSENNKRGVAFHDGLFKGCIMDNYVNIIKSYSDMGSDSPQLKKEISEEHKQFLLRYASCIMHIPIVKKFFYIVSNDPGLGRESTSPVLNTNDISFIQSDLESKHLIEEGSKVFVGEVDYNDVYDIINKKYYPLFGFITMENGSVSVEFDENRVNIDLLLSYPYYFIAKKPLSKKELLAKYDYLFPLYKNGCASSFVYRIKPVPLRRRHDGKGDKSSLIEEKEEEIRRKEEELKEEKSKDFLECSDELKQMKRISMLLDRLIMTAKTIEIDDESAKSDLVIESLKRVTDNKESGRGQKFSFIPQSEDARTRLEREGLKDYIAKR